jgi:hypothetical protein
MSDNGSLSDTAIRPHLPAASPELKAVVRRRFEARHLQYVGGRNEHRFPALQDERPVAAQLQSATVVKYQAIERLTGIGALHAPATGAAHVLRQARRRLSQRHHFGERIRHFCT